ncbi:MAG: GAF domain-containing protein [Myxococcota bacterium]
MLQDWRVSDGTAEIVVEADGWLGALAVGLGAFGLEFGALGRLSCSVQESGGAIARDATTGAEFRVEPVNPALRRAVAAVPTLPDPVAAALAQVAASAARPPDPTETGVRRIEAGRKVEATHSGSLTDDMVEDLFLRLGEVSAAASLSEASATALRIVLDLVPAGASAVLIRTRAGDGLRFRAASGLAATQLIDTVISLDRGIAGHVVQLGIGIAIEDVRTDSRHDRRMDRSTGFTTHAMLAVPVRADSGAVYGCLQLLNPPRPFSDGDFEVAARVAASLGSFLNSVYAAR